MVPALRVAPRAGWATTRCYGPIGIIISTVYASFPHALMILVVALATADARLFEAAEALSASRWRKFVTVTLPRRALRADQRRLGGVLVFGQRVRHPPR